MKKLLVIEDNQEVRENLEEILSLSNYDVITAENGLIGVEKALKEIPDLIICDVMMPELDGFGVLHILGKKPATSDIPFIFLTAKTEKEDFRKGMNLGADDYITKPFSIEELILKINVFLKRRFIKNDLNKSVGIGECTFDFKNLMINYKDQTIKLTQREGELMQQLYNNKNSVISRKDLLERVWGKEDYFLGRSMDVFISRLRKHLSCDPTVQIENVHGVGFRLTDATA